MSANLPMQWDPDQEWPESEPEMEALDFAPDASVATGGLEPFGLRAEFFWTDGVRTIDAPELLPRGGIAAEYGCAVTTIEREVDTEDAALLAAAAMREAAYVPAREEA